jgi:hypothetical protein
MFADKGSLLVSINGRTVPAMSMSQGASELGAIDAKQSRETMLCVDIS